MAGCITHQLVAEETMLRLPDEIGRTLQRRYHDYFWGAQGPDPLFFYRVLQRDNPGRRLHRAGASFLSAMKENAKQTRGGPAAAYALGYLTHCATDILFHPAVYTRLRSGPRLGFAHQQLENDWDVSLLRTLRGREAEGYLFPLSAERAEEEGELFPFLRKCGKPLGLNLSPGGLYAAFSHYLRYLRATHGNCYRTHERLHDVLHLKSVARLYPRRDLPCTDTDGPDALFEGAVSESMRLILLFCDALDTDMPLSDADFGRHLLTGELVPT